MRPAVLAHHSEPTDPELLNWLVHTIDSIVGVGPVLMLAAIGVVVVAIPATLAYLARRNRSPRG